MLKTLFQETIIELQLKKPFFEDVVLCNFLQILAVIAALPSTDSLSVRK